MIRVAADAETLAHAAAALFAEQARRAVALRGRFLILLAGGETPRRMYELLTRQPYFSGVPWGGVHFFWGDERCVPAGDGRSNYLLARQTMLDRLPVPSSRIHPVQGALVPLQAAADYELRLRGFFAGQEPRFDLAVLGLGEDGHTASLLPASGALAEKNRWTAVTKRDGEDFSRVTLTPVILNQARTVLFLVSGGGKAAMLSQILCGHDSPQAYPAELIKPVSGDLRWYADRAAALLIPRAK